MPSSRETRISCWRNRLSRSMKVPCATGSPIGRRASSNGADRNNTEKAVILAGGLGTRIAEESHMRPKPMIEIGGRPILLHVMNIYTSHGGATFLIFPRDWGRKNQE